MTCSFDVSVIRHACDSISYFIFVSETHAHRYKEKKSNLVIDWQKHD